MSTKGLLAALNADLRFTLDSLRVARAQAPHAPTYRLLLGTADDSFGGLTPHGGVQGHLWRTPAGLPVPALKPQHRPFNAATAEFMHTAVTSFVDGKTPISTTPEGPYAWPAVNTLAAGEVLWRGPDGYDVIADPATERLAWWGGGLSSPMAARTVLTSPWLPSATTHPKLRATEEVSMGAIASTSSRLRALGPATVISSAIG